MRICLVYDCLFPYTVGGAERWYRNLAAELVAAGHEVTYLTRRQWGSAERPDVPGVRVVAVSRGGPLYSADGRRAIGPPLAFGAGVLRHLTTHRAVYDVIHTGAFPFFSLMAARLALLARPTTIAVDWFEVWTKAYWRGYLGRVGGTIGHAIQTACVRLTPHAFAFSRLHAERLVAAGLPRPPTMLAGLYSGPLTPHPGQLAARDPLVVYAGRHIPEKRVLLIPAAIAAARDRIPGLRGLILGDGPERARLLVEIAALGLDAMVEAPGFVGVEEVSRAFERALCLLLPSAREGYGLVVIEAAAAATPSIVVAGADNAAAELVEDGVNGIRVREPDASEISDALVAVVEQGADLRATTAKWFTERAAGLTAQASARTVVERYATLER